jgi:hypothetical protein
MAVRGIRSRTARVTAPVRERMIIETLRQQTP